MRVALSVLAAIGIGLASLALCACGAADQRRASVAAAPPPLGLDPAATYAAHLAAEPQRFKMQHEVESAFGGRREVITGFLVVERPDRFFVYARSPMGPALFQVKSVPPSPFAVTAHLAQLQDDRFARYLARDIRRIYLTSCPGGAPAVIEEGLVVVRCALAPEAAPLTGDEDPDDALELRIGPGGELREKRFSRGGSPTAVVRYDDLRRVGDTWLAHRIELAHTSLPYRLRIVLAAADLAFDTDRVFGSPP